MMKLHQTFFAGVGILFFTAGVFTAAAQPSNAVTSAPVFVPDYSHANEPLPDGVIAWDALRKTTDATNGQDFARFTFTFTNVARKIDLVLATNIISITNLTAVANASFWARVWGKKIAQVASITQSTNTVTVTNYTLVPVTILSAPAGCGCTSVELPPVPWIIPPGSNGTIKISVNLAGKNIIPGVLPKYVTVSTDKGSTRLNLDINILPPPSLVAMSEEDRAKGVAAAKIDRQAVFKGDCVNCHAKNVEGKFGQQLFAATCAICHEANPRATMVPDLHNLKDPTNEEFWRTWITAGKAGTLMPAFASSQGGPLNDMQIASLAVYLNSIIPPHAPTPAAAK